MKTRLVKSIKLLFIGMFVLLVLGYPSISTSASSLNVDSYTTIFEPPQANFKIVVNKSTDCSYGSTNCASKGNYHTGVDSSSDLDIRAVADGIVTLVPMPPCSKTSGCPDHGMGNVVIIKHILLQGQEIYSLYAHLNSIDPALRDGMCVSKGTKLGIMGSSGQGKVNYPKYTPHLHLEFKTLPVLGDPKTARSVYESDYWGYISKKATDPYPDNWGYDDPMIFLGTEQAYTCAAIQTITTKISVENNPVDIAVNETTNRIYVSYENDAVISVIDGGTNLVTTNISIGFSNAMISVNPITNRVFVGGADTVQSIDGETNMVIYSSGFGGSPGMIDLEINPNNNRMYMVRNFDLLVWNFNSDHPSTFVASIPIPVNSLRVALNPNNNRIYVLTGTAPSRVLVIDGDLNTIIAEIPVGNNARYMAVNTASGNIYVSNEGDGSVSVIDGVSNSVTTTIWAGQFPKGISVDSVRNRIYVALGGENAIQVIDGATNMPIALVTVGNRPFPVAVNSITNNVYAGNYYDGTVDVFLGP